MADQSRFLVEPVDSVSKEQLSVRSLGELLEIQKQAEQQNDQATVQSLGELLADVHTSSPALERARSESGGEGRARSSSGRGEDGRGRTSSGIGEGQLRPRTLSGTGALIRPDRIIAIGLDGSDQCKTAFHWYIDELWKEGDQLLLVHVFEPPSLPFFSLKSGLSLPADEWQEKITESTKAAEKLMTHYEAACISYKINFLTVIRSGVPGEVMCKVAEELHAQFIVLGCRGRSLIRRTVLGSVSSYTINHSHVPVTVVPHPLQRNTRGHGRT